MNTTVNRRLVLTKKGGPEVIQIVTEPLPVPDAGQALVKVAASGVAFGDVAKRRGAIPGMPAYPYTPGYDCVGEVVSIRGADHGLAVGDPVGVFLVNGGNADYVSAPTSRLVKIPAGVDLRAAACIPLNYVTAWQLLFRVAKVQAGQTVLIHGAAGGVGTALLQLCQRSEVSAYGTASAGKHDVVRRYGGRPIDYRSEDFVARIMKETGGAGVDAVFDPVGGKDLARSNAVVKKGGYLAVFGMSSAVSRGALVALGTILRSVWYALLPNGKGCAFYGISASKFSNHENIVEDMRELFSMLARGQIEPLIGATFPLAQGQAAHELMESGPPPGKILIAG